MRSEPEMARCSHPLTTRGIACGFTRVRIVSHPLTTRGIAVRIHPCAYRLSDRNPPRGGMAKSSTGAGGAWGGA